MIKMLFKDNWVGKCRGFRHREKRVVNGFGKSGTSYKVIILWALISYGLEAEAENGGSIIKKDYKMTERAESAIV
jgi:hypothetical protein